MVHGCKLEVKRNETFFIIICYNKNLKSVEHSGPPESVLCRTGFAAITTTNRFGFVSASFAYLDTDFYIYLFIFLPIPQIRKHNFMAF